MRLDVYLVNQGFFPSREKAKLAIEKGFVKVNGQIADKAGFSISSSDKIEVGSNDLIKYVSIGGLKLEKAIREFSLDFTGKTVLDIGASTGGFTDCALQHGAVLVYAIDVGQNQLADSLRNNSNVISFEKMNYKDFYLDEKVDIVVMDVSFTSQKPVFSHISRWLKPGGWLISLIKPQFEMSQRMHFEQGIIKNEEIHQMVINSVVEHAAKHQLELIKITPAPEEVNKNKEFLAWFVLNCS